MVIQIYLPLIIPYKNDYQLLRIPLYLLYIINPPLHHQVLLHLFLKKLCQIGLAKVLQYIQCCTRMAAIVIQHIHYLLVDQNLAYRLIQDPGCLRLRLITLCNKRLNLESKEM